MTKRRDVGGGISRCQIYDIRHGTLQVVELVGNGRVNWQVGVW